MNRSRDVDLRIVTFNLRNGLTPERHPRHLWCARRAAVWAVLADLAPDVVALQEAHGFQLRGLLRGATGYTVAAARPRGRRVGERSPVLLRSDRFAVLSEQVCWFTDSGLRTDTPGARMAGAAHPRLLVTVRLLDRRSGDELVVMNTHLATEPAPRAASVRQLAAELALDVDTIVLGDFNATVDAVELGPLHAAGLAPAPVTGATFHRFAGTKAGAAIDHVFLSPRLTVAAAFVDHRQPEGRLASDHWPVVVDIARG